MTTLKGQLRVSQDRRSPSVRRQLQDAQGDVTTERQRADDAEDRAQEVQQQAQTLEANQRAPNLLTVLQVIGEPGDRMTLLTTPAVNCPPATASRDYRAKQEPAELSSKTG